MKLQNISGLQDCTLTTFILVTGLTSLNLKMDRMYEFISLRAVFSWKSFLQNSQPEIFTSVELTYPTDFPALYSSYILRVFTEDVCLYTIHCLISTFYSKTQTLGAKNFHDWNEAIILNLVLIKLSFLCCENVFEYLTFLVREIFKHNFSEKPVVSKTMLFI